MGRSSRSSAWPGSTFAIIDSSTGCCRWRRPDLCRAGRAGLAPSSACGPRLPHPACAGYRLRRRPGPADRDAGRRRSGHAREQVRAARGRGLSYYTRAGDYVLGGTEASPTLNGEQLVIIHVEGARAREPGRHPRGRGDRRRLPRPLTCPSLRHPRPGGRSARGPRDGGGHEQDRAANKRAGTFAADARRRPLGGRRGAVHLLGVDVGIFGAACRASRRGARLALSCLWRYR